MIDRARAFLAASVLALSVSIGQAAAQPAPIDARVVWVRGERAYIASSDSLALGQGTRLSFVVRRKPVATGEVTRVIDGGMAIARITSGTLPREKDLKRVSVLVEPAGGPGILRVGYPSRARSTLFFACDRITLVPPPSFGSSRVESGGHDNRLIREPGSLSGVPWPETLSVRLFDEAADEEIALERGELDVAVFWPGELSAHMRAQPRWQDHLAASRPRGLVAALWLGAPGVDSTAAGPPDDALLTSLNRELFRGDLGERWRGPSAGTTAPRRARYEVYPASPARLELQRFIDRAQGSPPVPDDRPVARLVYLDIPPGSPDSIAVAAAGYQRVVRVDPIFAFDCPVLFDPRLGSYLRDLGASALVELFDCVPAGRRP